MKGLSLLWFLRSLDNRQGKPRASLIYRRGSPCAVFANGVIGCPSAVDSHENRCIQSSFDDREMDKRLKGCWGWFSVIAEVQLQMCSQKCCLRWGFFCICFVLAALTEICLISILYKSQVIFQFIALKHSSLTLDSNISLLYLCPLEDAEATAHIFVKCYLTVWIEKHVNLLSFLLCW